MADFDQFFRNRLEEEQEFEGKTRNWRNVSRRLDAWTYGTGQGLKRLRLWQAVAVCGLIAVAVTGWLFHQQKTENQALIQEIAQLKTQINTIQSPQQQAAQQLLAAPSIHQNTATHPETTEAQQQVTQQGRVQQSLQNNTTTYPQTTGATAYSAPSSPQTDLQKHPSPPSAFDQIKNTYQQSVVPQNGLSTALQTGISPANNNQQDATVANAAEAAQRHSKTIQSDFDLLPNIALSAINSDKAAPLIKNLLSTDLATALAAAPVIKKASRISWLRAGAQVVAGVPTGREKGVSMIKGHGLSAEVAVWRGFSVTAGAEWTQMNIQTDSTYQRYLLPERPQPSMNHHNFDFKKVSSNLRQQTYTLGIRYTLKTQSRWKPSIQLAHGWAYHPSTIVSFEFEEPDHHGGPPPGQMHEKEWIARPTKSQWTDQNWRVGAGLAYETPHWAYILGADYTYRQGDHAPASGYMLARAGVQYKF